MFVRNVFFAPADDFGSGASPDEVAPEDAASARAAFLADAPPVLPSEDPTPAPVDDAAAEAVAIAEITGAGAPPAAAPAPAAPDPYAEYGGVESIRHALALRQTFNDPEGQKALAAQLLTQLGYTPDKIRAALEGSAPQAEPDPLDALLNLDDGDIVTGEQLKAIVAALANRDEQVSRQAVNPLENQWAAQQQSQLQQVADSTYIELLGLPEQTPEAQQAFLVQANAIQARAETLVTPGERDPQRIRLALLTAHTQIKGEDEARFRAYVQSKKAAAAALPTNIGGGQPPGGEPAKEPKNVKEASRMARESGIFG